VTTFALLAVCAGGALIALGVALFLLRHRITGWATRRGRSQAANGGFMFTATYLSFVSGFAALLGLGAVAVGLTR